MAARVVLTRPIERQSTLMQALLNDGFDVLSLPALSIQPATTAKQPQPQTYDWMVFVSRAAWQYYWASLQTQAPIFVWPPGCRIAAVGTATALAIKKTLATLTGQTPPVMTPVASLPQDSESLWQSLAHELRSGSNVLIVRGQTGRDWLAEKIRRQGCLTTIHEAYQRLPAPWSDQPVATLRQWGETGGVGVWLVTSQQGLLAIQAQWSTQRLEPWRPSGAVVIHPRLKAPVQSWLGQAPVMVTQPTDAAIVGAFTTGFTSGYFNQFC